MEDHKKPGKVRGHDDTQDGSDAKEDAHAGLEAAKDSLAAGPGGDQNAQ